MTLKWLHDHSFLGALISGNGKAERLRQVQAEANEAKQRQIQAVERAGMQTARITELAVELACDECDSLDILAIKAEVEAEIVKTADEDEERTDEAA